MIQVGQEWTSLDRLRYTVNKSKLIWSLIVVIAIKEVIPDTLVKVPYIYMYLFITWQWLWQ